MDLVIGALMLLFVITVSVISGTSRKRSQTAFGLRHGFRETPRGLAGTFNGREVEYGFLARNEEEWIFFELPIAIPRDFELSNETTMTRAKKHIGIEDVVVGDDEFDQIFFVKCGIEQAAQVWLTHPRRKLLLLLRQRTEHVSIRDGSLRLEFPTPTNLEAELKSVTNTAAHIDADGGWLIQA